MPSSDDRFSHEHMLSREDRRTDPTAWSDKSKLGMIATSHYLATAAGVEMLEKGGNAVDAAVASSLALGVCEPAGSGLGGMTMMVIHLAIPKHTFALAGPCRAPHLATPEAVQRVDRYRGYPAVAIPTNPATLDYALSRYGTLNTAEVLAPAIHIAEEGYPVSALQYRNALQSREALAANTAARLFLDSDARPFTPGTWFRQPELAQTLWRLADAGFQDFYQGDIARQIIDDMQRNSGFIRARDLAEIPWPQEKTPVYGQFGDAHAFSLGPPGGGLALIEMLNLFNAMARADFDPDSPQGVVLLAAIIRQARRDRRKYRMKIKADAVAEADEYLDADYARMAADIVRAELDSPGETSHVSVMDRLGNAVAMTQSIERSYGASVATDGLGFLYNGFLRAFKVKNKKHPYFLRPGAMARSNAAPTLLIKDGVPWVAIGNTGSERMASGIFEVLVRLGNHTPFAAVHAPRLHCTPESIVLIEAERFPEECLTALAKHGFNLQQLDPYSFKMGGLQLVVREADGFVGVGEPRRDGTAAGPLMIPPSLHRA